MSERGWVVRLGAYLRIFGKTSDPVLADLWIKKAKEREAEFAVGGLGHGTAGREGLDLGGLGSAESCEKGEKA